ncbi:hypothetical protein Tco_0550196, partial [Tanacetum coccineum]
GGKLHDKSAEESWEIIEDLAFYDNKRWNDPSDLVCKPVKEISLPTNTSCTPERRLIELEDQDGKFEEAIYRQIEEINERMTKMFGLLKEYTKRKAPEKLLVREEGSKPFTKYVNVISLVKKKDKEVEEYDEVVDIEVDKQSKGLGDEEVQEEEEVNENELDKNGDDNPTR